MFMKWYIMQVFSEKERFFLIDGWAMEGKVELGWGYSQPERGLNLRRGVS